METKLLKSKLMGILDFIGKVLFTCLIYYCAFYIWGTKSWFPVITSYGNIDKLYIISSEYSYFEGQRDALDGDVKISFPNDSTFIWTKSPWNDGKKPIFNDAMYKKLTHKDRYYYSDEFIANKNDWMKNCWMNGTKSDKSFDLVVIK